VTKTDERHFVEHFQIWLVCRLHFIRLVYDVLELSTASLHPHAEKQAERVVRQVSFCCLLLADHSDLLANRLHLGLAINERSRVENKEVLGDGSVEVEQRIGLTMIFVDRKSDLWDYLVHINCRYYRLV